MNKHKLRFIIKQIYRELFKEYNLFLKKENINFVQRIRLKKKLAKEIAREKKYQIKEKKEYQLFKVSKKLASLAIPQKELFKRKGKLHSISAPNFINKENKFDIVHGKSPNIEVALLKNCFVYGSSISISDDSILYNPIIYNMTFKHYFSNLYFQMPISLKRKILELDIKKSSSYQDESTYIHLLDSSSINYFHWLFEIIPKLIQINEIILQSSKLKEQGFTILVDKDIPKQFLEIIDTITNFKYQIKSIDKFEKLHCKQLICCTPFWHAFNTKPYYHGVKYFFIDKTAISLVKTLALPPTKKPFRKVYLKRSNKQVRSLINEKEIEQFLIKNNFEFYDMATLSFKKQVKLMNEAKVVVAPAGAAVSNIIFMQKNTHVIIFIANFKYTNPYVFQPLADVAQISLINILSENTGNTPDFDLEISLDYLKEALIFKNTFPLPK